MLDRLNLVPVSWVYHQNSEMLVPRKNAAVGNVHQFLLAAFSYKNLIPNRFQPSKNDLWGDRTGKAGFRPGRWREFASWRLIDSQRNPNTATKKSHLIERGLVLN